MQPTPHNNNPDIPYQHQMNFPMNQMPYNQRNQRMPFPMTLNPQINNNIRKQDQNYQDIPINTFKIAQDIKPLPLDDIDPKKKL